MPEFSIESGPIDVERIMQQIRARLSEKRGADYTEKQIRELANVKLETFLDPKSVRSGMVEFYQNRLKEQREALGQASQAPPSFEFDPDLIYRSSRGFFGQVLYRIRKLLNPLLKFFFNPGPIVQALTVQQQVNKVISQMVPTQAEFIEIAALNYEVMNNLVVEMTRLSIDMKNHKMRVESVAGRLDFDERRARALEKVVQYREGGKTPAATEGNNTTDKRKRRRRRGRRRPTTATEQTASASTDQPSSTSGDETGQTATAVSGEDRPSETTTVSSVTDRPVSEQTASSTEEPSQLSGSATPAASEVEPPSEEPTPSSGEAGPSEQ